jgi:hypothetical protein
MVVHQLEGFGRALGGPFFEVDIALGPDVEVNEPVAQPALYALDALVVVAVQILRQPQDGDQVQQGSAFLGRE